MELMLLPEIAFASATKQACCLCPLLFYDRDVAKDRRRGTLVVRRLRVGEAGGAGWTE